MQYTKLIRNVSLLLLVLFSASVYGLGLNDSLMYYYNFEDISAASQINVVNTSILNLSNTGSSYTYGINNWGRTFFNPNDQLVNQTEGYVHSTTWTINVWLNFTEQNLREIMTKYDSSQGWYLGMAGAPGYEVRLLVQDGAGYTEARINSSEYTLNEWHMYTFVVQGSQISAYIDGAHFVTETGTGGTGENNRKFYIGDSPDYVATALDMTIDEVGIWHRALGATEVADLYASSTSAEDSFVYDCIPEVTNDSTHGLGVLNFIYNGTLITGIDMIHVNLNGSRVANASLDGHPYNNRTYIPHTFAEGDYEVTCDVVSDSGVYHNGTISRILHVSDISVVAEYNDPVVEGSSESIKLNVTINQSVHSTVTGTLYYNGTAYATTPTQYGDIVQLDTTLTIPAISNTSETKDFYWNYTLYYLNSSTEDLTSATYTQTVNEFSLYNCTVNPVINFSFWDEDTSTNITVDLVINTMTTTISGEVIYINTSAEDVHSVAYCLDQDDTLDVTFFLQYFKDTYSPREFRRTLTLVNGTTVEQELYMKAEANTSDITVYVIDTNSVEQTGVTVVALQYDVDSNTYKTIDTGVTDDDGLTELTLDTSSSLFYQFVIYSGTSTLYTTNLLNIGTSGTVTIQIPGEQTELQEYVDLVEGMSVSATYYNATSTLIVTYNDANSLTSEVCIKVYENNVTASSEYYTSCSTSTTDTFSTVLSLGQTYMLKVIATSSQDGVDYNIYSEMFDLSTPNKIFGLGIVLLVVIMLVALMLMGKGNPVTGIVLMMFGLGAAKVSGFIALGWVGFIGITLAAIIVVVMLRT